MGKEFVFSRFYVVFVKFKTMKKSRLVKEGVFVSDNRK